MKIRDYISRFGRKGIDSLKKLKGGQNDLYGYLDRERKGRKSSQIDYKPASQNERFDSLLAKLAGHQNNGI